VNVAKISRVVQLIHVFMERAHEVTYAPEFDYPISGTAATGALRRTSMELTRALADLRRPG
jgi:hypothetical protein